MSPIRLQLLLKPVSRNARGKKDARAAAEQLGLEITGEGAATLSARCDHDRFVEIFGCEPKHGSGGTSNEELAVPDALVDYASSVSVAPRHTYMGES